MPVSDTKKRLGILRGGAGREYLYSLQKGGDIMSNINENLGDKYKTFDILIDKNHIWHFNGVPIIPADLTSKIDIVWNTTHPSYSNILESLYIPHVSTPSFPATLQNSKELLREHMKKLSVPMPRSVVLPLYQKDFDGPVEEYVIRKAKEVFEKFSSPWIVKSYTEDSNMGIHLVKTFPELAAAIEDGVMHQKSILVEEFIAGKIASVHSVPMFRNEPIYTFPIGDTFGNFTPEEKEILSRLAQALHAHIGAKHYLKSDFVMNSKGRVYLLSIESTPDVRPDSHFWKACESAGTRPSQVIEHILGQI
jgi:D-alanine-D-alanine ligase-like ATP-grasp enzyme